MIKGTVFNIQRFSIHDGPGIRTTVFLKGCPLHCAWCHNPEGLSIHPQVLYNRENCTVCGACIRVCPQGCHFFVQGRHAFDRASCVQCQQCAHACSFDALTACGQTMVVQEVVDTVLRDMDFYRTSGGGMTLSGGEPLMQPDFSHALLRAAGEQGIHRAVETCGYAGEDAVRKVLSQADLVLMDWKHSNAQQLQRYTGAALSVIENTAALLKDMGKPVILRCPIIPGVNDDPEHFDGIAALAKRYDNIQEINIMPYHTFGSEKRSRLTENAALPDFRVPDSTESDGWAESLQKRVPHLTVKKG